jgi:hypothetical protein
MTKIEPHLRECILSYTPGSCLQAHVPPRVTVERSAHRSSHQPINHHKVGGRIIYLHWTSVTNANSNFGMHAHNWGFAFQLNP